MKKLYIKEVQTELDKCKINHEVFTEEDLSGLPAPLKRYFKFCGYIGKEKMAYVKIVIDNVIFKRGVDKPGLKLKSEQYNFVYEPTRIVYMDSRLFGIIPFEGRDKYQDGKGYMTGKLLKKVTLFDVTGDEFNKSGLVTFLAESMLLPSSILQSYIKWEEIDSNHVKAVIAHRGISASGIFTFKDNGEFIKFETNERYMDKGNGVCELEKWTAEVGEYVEKNGVRIPSRMKAAWNLPGGDFVYFDGDITDIVPNA